LVDARIVRAMEAAIATTDPPYIAYLSGFSTDVHLRPRSNTEVRTLDGLRMRTNHEMMSEFARGLSFPDYFGHNMDALEECLGDLSWLSGAHVAIVIDRTEHVLDRDPAGPLHRLRVLREVITSVGLELRTPSSSHFPGDVQTLHVFAFCSPGTSAAMRQRLEPLLEGEVSFLDS
jgi:hypothetical protein